MKTYSLQETARLCGIGFFRAWRIVARYKLIPSAWRSETGKRAPWLLNESGVREVGAIAGLLAAGASMQETRGVAKALQARGHNPFSKGRFAVEVEGRHGRIVRIVSENGKVHAEIVALKGGSQRLLFAPGAGKD